MKNSKSLSQLRAEQQAYHLWFNQVAKYGCSDRVNLHMSELLRKVNDKLVAMGDTETIDMRNGVKSSN